MAVANADLSPGFADRVVSAQTTFRAVMDAMARPGRVQRIAVAAQGPLPLMPASTAVVLTLCDQDTPVWLDDMMTPEVARWIVFHTGASITRDPARAAFALVANASALATFDRFALGSPDYPDRSTTLIIQMTSLIDGPSFALRGPGIDGVATLNAPLSPQLVDALAANHALFPRGVDVVLVADDSIVALPRTTQLSSMGG